MPLGRRRPLVRAAAVGGAAYVGSKHGAKKGAEQAAQEEEQAAQQQQAYAPPPPPAAPPPPAEPVDPTTEKIKELAELHTSGALTDEEFAAAKAKALGIG